MVAIRVNLRAELKARGMTSRQLAARIGITEVNLSRLATGKARSIRFGTLEAVCRELRCKPGDILDYIDEGAA